MPTTSIRAVLIAACSIAALTACSTSADDASAAPDDQSTIRETIDTYFTGLTGNYDAFTSAICPALADDLLSGTDKPAFEVDAAQRLQTDGRPIVDWFDDVSIDGTHADVTLSVHVLGGSRPDVGPQKWTTSLERDGDDWSVCTEAVPDRATQRKLDVAVDERDAKAAVQSFYDALGVKDFATAESVSCDPLRSQIPANDPAAYATLEKLVSIDGITVNGNAARVPATVELPDGTQLSINYVLERQSDAWKVCDAL